MARTPLLGALVALAPYVPDPDEARDLLRRELAGSEYRPGLFQRLRDAIVDFVDDLFSGLSPDLDVPSWWGVVVLALLVAGLAFLGWRLFLARSGRRARGEEAGTVFGGERLPARQHRERARAARADGRFDDAVVEAVRALAAGLIERGLVPDTQGLTVLELATTARRLFPGHADGLERGGRVFDEVRYGRGGADAGDADALIALEATLAAERPGQTSDGPVQAVPR